MKQLLKILLFVTLICCFCLNFKKHIFGLIAQKRRNNKIRINEYLTHTISFRLPWKILKILPNYISTKILRKLNFFWHHKQFEHLIFLHHPHLKKNYIKFYFIVRMRHHLSNLTAVYGPTNNVLDLNMNDVEPKVW